MMSQVKASSLREYHSERMLGMKNSNVETTSAQSAPSTVFNIPSEINIPSLDTTASPSAPVVVNNPAPRVITIPGQAPVQQAPVQQAPVTGNGDQAKADAQAAADAQAKADAEAKAKADAETKAANQKKAAALNAEATSLRAQANQARLDASLLSPDKDAVAKGMAAAQALEDQATAKDAEAAALGG